MALSDILEAMEAEAGKELAQIAQHEREGVLQIRAAAHEQIQAANATGRQAARALMQRERARRFNRARLAAQRAASRARADLFQEALAIAKARLAELRTCRAYPEILQALVSEALAQIEGDAVVRGDQRDANLLEVMCAGHQVQSDLNTLGGIEVRSADWFIVVDNTLEARLAKAEPLLRHKFTQWVTSTPTRGYAR